MNAARCVACLRAINNLAVPDDEGRHLFLLHGGVQALLAVMAEETGLALACLGAARLAHRLCALDARCRSAFLAAAQAADAAVAMLRRHVPLALGAFPSPDGGDYSVDACEEAAKWLYSLALASAGAPAEDVAGTSGGGSSAGQDSAAHAAEARARLAAAPLAAVFLQPVLISAAASLDTADGGSSWPASTPARLTVQCCNLLFAGPVEWLLACEGNVLLPAALRLLLVAVALDGAPAGSAGIEPGPGPALPPSLGRVVAGVLLRVAQEGGSDAAGLLSGLVFREPEAVQQPAGGAGAAGDARAPSADRLHPSLAACMAQRRDDGLKRVAEELAYELCGKDGA
jgi:hypothetical protein